AAPTLTAVSPYPDTSRDGRSMHAQQAAKLTAPVLAGHRREVETVSLSTTVANDLTRQLVAPAARTHDADASDSGVAVLCWNRARALRSGRKSR
ncbi:MAG: hypothetical protein MUF54_03530, partial [Polyangiaceae bacterium]|nr:hypothetical protein [Polyangiaceae bacterium]